MTDTSVVFNVIGKDSGISGTLNKVKGLFKSTGVEGAAAFKIVDHEVEKLDHDIKSAKDSLQVLAREFAKASAGAERLQISRQMSRQTGELGKLTKARNLLDIPDASIMSEGKGIGAKLSSSITAGLGNLAPMTTAIGAAGIAAAPFLGATIAGAVVGAAGAGGVIGGVMLAAKDARVQAAWTQFTAGAKSQLEHVADPFVPATLSAIRTVRVAFDGLQPTLKNLFADTAGYLGPLTSGLTGFVSQVASGFAKAAASAGPVIRVISDELPNLGSEIGHLFEVMADHADEGAIAIGAIFKLIELGIGTVSTLVGWLSKAFGLAHTLGLDGLGRMFGLFDGASGKIDKATASTSGFQEAVDETADSSATAADKIKAMQDALDDFADSNISAYEATTRAKAAIGETTKAIEKNGRTLSLNSEKGRANRDAIASLAKTFNTVTTANDKANVSAKSSSATYDRQRAAFIRAATGAGMARKAAEDLADKLLKLPKSKTINLNANGADARGDIKAVQNALNRLPSVKTIYIQGRIDKVLQQARNGALLGARAAGGPVARGVPYLVGEEGPELVVPDNNATVYSHTKTKSALSGGRTSNAVPSLGNLRPTGGGGARTLRIEVAGEARVAAFVRYMIRTYNLVDGAIA